MYFVEKSKGLNVFKQFDYPLFLAILILSGIGLLVVKSATLTRADGGARIMMMQFIGFALGVLLSIIITSIDYKDFKVLGAVLYLVSAALLVLVLVMGSGDDLGSRSWLNIMGVSLQPSELAKVSFIMVLAVFLERINEGQKKQNILKLIFYAFIMIGLVVIQKDFGTTMVFMFIFFVMLFVCNLPYKYIVMMIGAIMVSAPFMWIFVLNDKRKARIISFIFPGADPLDSGYNVARSKSTIGSGQLMGKGIFQGIQTQNSLVPVKESDFIFSVIGEELGFIGSVIVVLLIMFILVRCIYIAKNSRDSYGAFLVVGIASMFAIHSFENIGMSIGLLPVTGIPLPFVSQGGTSLVTNFIAAGILLSVSARRKKVIFNNSQ